MVTAAGPGPTGGSPGAFRMAHDTAAVPGARRALVSALLLDPRCTGVADEVAVVASELLGNAVRHAAPLHGTGSGGASEDGGVLVRWSCDDDEVRVEVVDGGGGPLVAADAPPLATSGRGLAIVAVLSRCWGTSTDAQGRHTVWAALPLTG